MTRSIPIEYQLGVCVLVVRYTQLDAIGRPGPFSPTAVTWSYDVPCHK